mmetsp:Transcript_33491/g.58675  ORF Transcript_33491/g.58675 Transcript_33491/m.58675 type:complete len:239 (-) Transcript_33491:156-872(-)
MLSEDSFALVVTFLMLYCLIAICSLVSWVFIGIVYSVGERMSLPPGGLIASQAFSYFVNTLVVSIYLVLSLTAMLYAEAYINPRICELALVVIIYTRILCLSYDLAVSIELIYKVRRPHSQQYLLRLPFYHVLCQVIAVSFAIDKHFEASVVWLDGEGCGFDQTPVSINIELGISNLLFFCSMCNCAYLLIKMQRARQLTNFIVAHAVWVETVGFTSVLSLNMFYLNYSYSAGFVMYN